MWYFSGERKVKEGREGGVKEEGGRSEGRGREEEREGGRGRGEYVGKRERQSGGVHPNQNMHT